MSNAPLMPKATAVWLVDNTALTFDQVAEFTKMHPLEIRAIADGDAAQGIKGMDPISTGQLSREEIERGEADPDYRLKLGDGYQLHGTPNKASIGTSATHGCVRMHDEDIEWLYNNVPIGTKVYLY